MQIEEMTKERRLALMEKRLAEAREANDPASVMLAVLDVLTVIVAAERQTVDMY